MKKIKETYQVKFRDLLPKNFPDARFDYLASKILLHPDAHHPLVCDVSENMNYRKAPLFEYRSQIYPLFTDSLDTLDWIAVTHRKETILLSQLSKFKQIVIQEKANFESFFADCTVIREISEQIKLLEKHLIINQERRKPTQLVKSSQEKNLPTFVRLNKSISRQLAFAKRHLESNEKLFLAKWKRFLEYETEKTLCPY